jgi:hypothetical protein
VTEMSYRTQEERGFDKKEVKKDPRGACGMQNKYPRGSEKLSHSSTSTDWNLRHAGNESFRIRLKRILSKGLVKPQSCGANHG